MENKRMNTEQLLERFAQTEKIGLGDFVICGALALVTLIISLLWQFPGTSPTIWGDMVTASGVRPAAGVIPGYWRCMGTVLFRMFGIDGGCTFLKIFGNLSLMGLVVAVYASLREVLAFVTRTHPQFSKKRTIVMQLASAVGAMAYICSDAVWSAGQTCSETILQILLTISALEFYFVFLRKGTLKYAYLCALCLGLLTAESPIGIILLLVFVGIYAFVLMVMPSMESPFFQPATIAVGKWHMTFIFLAAVLFGIALNCVTFSMHHGLSAVGMSAGEVPLKYLLAYYSALSNAADRMGWILFFGGAVMPFFISLVRFPQASDEELFLHYSSGIVFLVCGTAAAAQSCALPSLWYWSYGNISSQALLTIGAYFSAVTLATAVTVLGVDALCRNHVRLAVLLYGANLEDPNTSYSDVYADAYDLGSRTTRIMRVVGLVAVPLLLLCVVVPGRSKPRTREMLDVINDAVVAMVDEAEDSEFIFTDGNLDPAIEFESARRGKNLKCVSLLGKSRAMDVYLRTRGLGNDRESLFSFRHDGGMGLRTWMRDKPEMLAKSSVQIGFDLWKRDGKAIPEIGGLLSRPAVDVPAEKRQEYIARAKALADRVLAVYAHGGVKHCTDPAITRAFTAVQWRIARMCTYRGEVADLEGRASEAIAEVSLAKRLNDCNGTYQGLMRTIEHYNAQLMTRLTPREGLQLALVRADFTMAKYYAEDILVADPENPDANFGMGMYYLKQRQLTRAEEYLKRCLIRDPRQPAVYNNLAMLQMEQGKFEAAISNVNKALEIIPDSTAVKDTKKAILDRQEAIKRQREQKAYEASTKKVQKGVRK